MAEKNTKKKTTKPAEVVEIKIEDKKETKKEYCKTYTTQQENEDLCKICASMGGSVTETIKANNLVNYNKIPAGTVLKIK